MKRLLCTGILLAMGTGIAAAQSVEDRDFRTELQPESKVPDEFILRADKPNQFRGEDFTLSGALVQVFKTDNPLQLINPFAPAEYGSGYANLVIEPDGRKATGISLLAMEF